MSEFEEVADNIGRLLTQKNQAYGDSFARCGEVLRVMYPNGVAPCQYGDLLAVARIIDKLFRIAARKDAFGENPFEDIAGYGILGVCRDQRRKGNGGQVEGQEGKPQACRDARGT